MARFHTALYSSSINNGSVLLQVTNVSDPILATSGSGFFIPDADPSGPALNKLVRVCAVGTNLTRCQLTSYSIRQYALFDVTPVNVGTAIENPPRFLQWDQNPWQLKTNEELDAFALQSNAGAQRETVAIWIADGPLAPVKGNIFTMHWTATTTLTANAWTQCAITFDNGLPEGTLAIVGMDAFSAGALFARVVPRTGSAYRPGVFACQARDQFMFPYQRYGVMGEFMRFKNVQPPQVEFFSTSADTAEEGYFDLMIVG